MERAYSTLTITKSVEAERTVEGVASVPSVDRMGDIVESKGVRWRKDASGRPDVPWLYQHRHHEPIGRIEWLKANPDGLRFKARMPKVNQPGPLKDRLDTAYAEISAGLVRGISIGFMPLKAEPIDTGWRFKEISLYEISSVTIPACEEACVEVVKRYDEAARHGGMPDVSPLPAQSAAELPPNIKIADFRTTANFPVANPFRWNAEQAKSETLYEIAQAQTLEMVSKNRSPAALSGFVSELAAKSVHFDDLLRRMGSTLEALGQQNQRFERSIAEMKAAQSAMAYKGVFKAGDTYVRGNWTTWHGSVWHCNAATTGDEPGTSDAWTLAVKSGKNGRDAR